MTCPKCQGELTSHTYADVSFRQCASCQALFLERIELGALIEAENDWHAHQSSETTPMPRITPDMTAPPPRRARSRSFLDALFRNGG
ncbi:MAG: zf-TFIIB domain-containing protein [Marmoricola sp.]